MSTVEDADPTEVTTPKPAREPRSLRLRPTGIAAVQRLADQEGQSWNEMACLLLSFATYKWEPGWVKTDPGKRSPHGVCKDDF